MVLRDQLADIIRQTTPLFEKIKVRANDLGMTIHGHSADKMFFVVGRMKQASPELLGDFGIGSLPMLRDLLNFTPYKTDEASLRVHRAERSTEGSYVAELEFRDERGGFAKFKTIDPSRIEDVNIQNIPWNITVTPNKANISELTQLANLFTEVDSNFGVKLQNKTLFVTIGTTGTHHQTSMVFATDVHGDLSQDDVVYSTKHLLAVLKNVASSEVQVSDKRVVGVTIETDYGTYNYYLRGK